MVQYKTYFFVSQVNHAIGNPIWELEEVKLGQTLYFPHFSPVIWMNFMSNTAETHTQLFWGNLGFIYGESEVVFNLEAECINVCEECRM